MKIEELLENLKSKIAIGERIEFLISENNKNIESRNSYIELFINIINDENFLYRQKIVEIKNKESIINIIDCEYLNPGCCASPLPFCSKFMLNTNRESCEECIKLGMNKNDSPEAIS